MKFTISYDITENNTDNFPIGSGEEGSNYQISSAIPSKDGHRFAGWLLTPNSDTAIPPGYTLTIPSHDLLLTPLWEEQTENYVSIWYCLNGAEKENADYMINTFSSANGNTSYHISLSGIVPTLNGYYFNGWSTNKNGSSSISEPNDVISGEYTTKTNIVLYAMWKLTEENQYTMRYVLEGFTSSPAVVKLQGASPYRYIVEKDITFTPTVNCDYKEFAGWTTEVPPSGFNTQILRNIEYRKDDVIVLTNSNPNIVLYAVQEPIVTYHCIIKDTAANGGVVYFTKEMQLSQDAFTVDLTTVCNTVEGFPPDKEGLYCIGLSSDESSLSVDYKLNDTIVMEFDSTKAEWYANDVEGLCYYNQTETFYLVWADKLNYSLNFDIGGGKNGPSNINAVSDITPYNVTIPNTIPTKANHDFLGWCRDKESDGSYVQPGETIELTATIPSITLYAVWKNRPSVNTFTLLYNANGGSGAPDPEYKSQSEAECSFTVSDIVPTKSGRTFLGWSKSSTVIEPDYRSGDNIVVESVEPSVTLFAVYEIDRPHFDPATDMLIRFQDLKIHTNALKLKELQITDKTPMPQTIGGIPANTTFDNESLVDVVHRILYPYIAPICALHIEPHGGIYEKNTSVPITRWLSTITRKSEEITDVTIQNAQGITVGSLSPSQLSIINESIHAITLSGTLDLIVTTNTTFYMTVTDAKNNQVRVQSEEIRFVDPVYVGAIPRAVTNINSIVINGLEKKITELGSSYTITQTMNDEKLVFAYPETYGKLLRIRDQNGYVCTNLFNTNTIDIVTGTNATTTYRYYSLIESVNLSDYKVTFVFAEDDNIENII